MKPLICGAVVASLLALGCTKESGKGGPGAGSQQSEDVFTLKVPKTINVKQGETKKVKITVDRGRMFDQSVKLTIKAPQGVELTPAAGKSAEVKKGETEREFVVKAGKNAKAGKHTVQVSGKPQSGAEAIVMFTIYIDEEKEKPEQPLMP